MKTLSKLFLSAGIAITLNAAVPSMAQDASGIDFGDDTGSWTEDGECDDPRFIGEGMANSTSEDDLLRDATDCRNLFEAGSIKLSNLSFDPDLTVFEGTELGDDSYEWANDGQCDDARFTGEGMATSPDRDAIKKDRSDCSAGFQLGRLTLVDDLPPRLVSEYDGIDFGTDKGEYAGDNECDDPRFFGEGVSSIALTGANIGTDRKDCLEAYKAGGLFLKEARVIDGYFFGNDASFSANDGECDDPRFEGPGMASKLARSGIEHDGTDCMSLWRKDKISATKRTEYNGFLIVDGLVFGDDSGQYPNDSECDDPNFIGPGVADGSSRENAGKDRSDCLESFQRGTAKRAPAIPVNTNLTYEGIRFGDNDSPFANDGECDDPRFTGAGMAASFREEDRNHDAADCLAAFQDGDIELK